MGTKKGLALAQLGKMLDYPQANYTQDMQKLSQSVALSYPQVGKELDQFIVDIGQRSLGELEELYTRTFDLAAIVSPYVTGYIYGDENFNRGTLMAKLGEKYAELGFNLGGELPDHLSVLLKFAGWLDQETLDELTDLCLRDPVGEMVKTLNDSGNPFYFLLSSILTILKTDDRGDKISD